MRNKVKENWGVGITFLSKNSNLNVAASRLYYAIFQSVLWYARSKKHYMPEPGMPNRVHLDMANIVNAEFPSNADHDKRHKRAFREFHALRLTADYEPDPPSVEEIKEVIQDGQFVKDHFLKLAET